MQLNNFFRNKCINHQHAKPFNSHRAFELSLKTKIVTISFFLNHQELMHEGIQNIPTASSQGIYSI